MTCARSGDVLPWGVGSRRSSVRKCSKGNHPTEARGGPRWDSQALGRSQRMAIGTHISVIDERGKQSRGGLWAQLIEPTTRSDSASAYRNRAGRLARRPRASDADVGDPRLCCGHKTASRSTRSAGRRWTMPGECGRWWPKWSRCATIRWLVTPRHSGPMYLGWRCTDAYSDKR